MKKGLQSRAKIAFASMAILIALVVGPSGYPFLLLPFRICSPGRHLGGLGCV
jgi:hypothetical protein